MKRIGFLFCCLVLVLSGSPAFARERLLRMDVRAVVGADATLTVTERIEFVAGGKEIRRGLVRTLPLIRREGGHMITGDFSLVSATLDGRTVPFRLLRSGGEMEVHLGDDSLLSHGIHTYVLTYTMTRQLIFRDDGDGLCWNVTGDDWTVPVEAASFTLVPPGGATVLEADAWTEADGSRDQGWTRDPDGVFRTTRALAPGESFIVSAAWPKGFLAYPPGDLPWERISPPWAWPLFFLLVLLIALGYGGRWLAGRDPKRGPSPKS